MALTLTWAAVLPFLSPRATAERTKTEPWLGPLQVLLNGRYGERITQAPADGNESLFVSFAGDAINRRIMRPADFDFVAQQGIGPANVRYRERVDLSKWFTKDELDQMDAVTGVGSINSHRTPAPDAQRYANLLRSDDNDEVD